MKIIETISNLIGVLILVSITFWIKLMWQNVKLTAFCIVACVSTCTHTHIQIHANTKQTEMTAPFRFWQLSLPLKWFFLIEYLKSKHFALLYPSVEVVTDGRETLMPGGTVRHLVIFYCIHLTVRAILSAIQSNFNKI